MSKNLSCFNNLFVVNKTTPLNYFVPVSDVYKNSKIKTYNEIKTKRKKKSIYKFLSKKSYIVIPFFVRNPKKGYLI